MFGIGPMEMCIVAGVGVLLFGKKLPSLARSLGSTLVEFKKGVAGVTDDVHEIERTIKDPSPPRVIHQPRPQAGAYAQETLQSDGQG